MSIRHAKISICILAIIFLLLTSLVNCVTATNSNLDTGSASSFNSGDTNSQVDDAEVDTHESLIAEQYYIDPAQFSETMNQPENFIVGRSGDGSVSTEQDNARGTGARATDTESEPNDNIGDANLLTAGNHMQGTLTYQTDVVDSFHIKLNGGGGGSIDKITITPTFVSPPDINNKAVGIIVAFYEIYGGDEFYFDLVKLATTKYGPFLNPYPWPTTNEVVAHATRTQEYYCVVEGAWFVWSDNNSVINPETAIGYDIEIQVETTTSTDGDNDMFNGTLIEEPITGETVIQATDHWDWYIIETLTTEKPTDISLQLKITDSERSETDAGTGYVFYVRVYAELWYYNSGSGKYVVVSGTGDHHSQYGINPIKLEINDTYEKAYLGVHVQQMYMYGGQPRLDTESGDSFIEYNIEKLYIDLYNDPPLLQELQVDPKKGNKLDDYTFTVVYRDMMGDPPLFVNLTVDDGKELEMELDTSAESSYQDGDYSNGEQYFKVVSGSILTKPTHEIGKDVPYYTRTRDYLESIGLPMTIKKTPTLFFEVIDNTPPTLSPNPAEEWIIYEDTNASYFDVTSLFDDVDEANYPDELTYQIYTPYYLDWTKDKVVTENLTVDLLDTNWTLLCQPEPDKFGIEYIQIRAYDPEGEMKDPPEYVEYVLQIDVKPVNDAPILTEIPDYTGDYAFEEDSWVNINFTATDEVDGNVDTLTFSTNVIKIIPHLDPDSESYDDSYEFSFDEETGYLSFIPRNEQVGTYKITVTVTDSGTIAPTGLTDSQTFSLQIKNTNDPPTAVISSPQEAEVYNTTVDIFFDGMNSTDPDFDHGDKLRFIWESNVSGNLKKGEDYGTFSMKLTQPGLHTISLEVKDNDREVSSTSIEIKIIAVVEGYGEDTDGDGIPDSWEAKFAGLDPEIPDSNLDEDNDNFTNLAEFLGEDGLASGGDSSDPTDAFSIPGDTDGDQLPDDWERDNFGHLNQDPTDDPDGDKWTNLEEYLGDDGKPGNNDFTDPTAPEDFPDIGEDRTPIESSGDDEDWTMIILILIVVVIIVLLLAFMYIKKRKEEEREMEEEMVAMAAAREQEAPPVPPTPMPVAAPMPVQGPGVGVGAQPMPMMAAGPPPQQPMVYQQQVPGQYQQPQVQQPMPMQMPMPMVQQQPQVQAQPQVQQMPAPAPTPAPTPILTPTPAPESLPPSPEVEEPEVKKPKPKKKKKPKVKSQQSSKCPSCGVPVQPSWFLCPSCKTPLS